MPEQAGVPRAWEAMGMLLPRSIREGVFEPAYRDLWRSIALEPNRSVTAFGAWASVFGYLAASIWYALPRYFSETLSRRARWATGVGLALTAAVLLLILLPYVLAGLGYTY